MTRALLVSALVVLATGPAVAGDFQVQPTRLDLTQRGAPTELTISNRGRVAARFEAKVFEWKQDEQGVMQLQATKEIVVYPTLFAIGPGAKRAVRVATTAGPAASERSYRIFVEELPMPRGAAGATSTAVAVRTRMGVPIFVRPARSEIRGTVDANVRAGVLHVAIHNRGTVHAKVTSLRVIAKDAAGAVVFDQQQSAWYVLAGARRRFALALDAGACRRASQLSIEAVSEDATWKTTTVMSRDGCAETK